MPHAHTPVDEQEETRRGALLAEVLALKPIRNSESGENGRYRTHWGTKTELGLYRTVKRIIEEGN